MVHRSGPSRHPGPGPWNICKGSFSAHAEGLSWPTEGTQPGWTKFLAPVGPSLLAFRGLLDLETTSFSDPASGLRDHMVTGRSWEIGSCAEKTRV